MTTKCYKIANITKVTYETRYCIDDIYIKQSFQTVNKYHAVTSLSKFTNKNHFHTFETHTTDNGCFNKHNKTHLKQDFFSFRCQARLMEATKQAARDQIGESHLLQNQNEE